MWPTPEVFGPNAEPRGKIASQFTQDWINSMPPSGRFSFSSIKYNSQDKYGRALGFVFCHHGDDTTQCLNDDLKAAGMEKSVSE